MFKPDSGHEGHKYLLKMLFFLGFFDFYVDIQLRGPATDPVQYGTVRIGIIQGLHIID